MVVMLNHACVMGNSNHYINWLSSHMFLKTSSLILEHFVIPGTTVILGAVAVAVLGSRCNAVTVMVLNLAATPIELRYTVNLFVAKPIPDCLPRSQVSVRSLHISSLVSSSMLVTVTLLSFIESNSALRQ